MRTISEIRRFGICVSFDHCKLDLLEVLTLDTSELLQPLLGVGKFLALSIVRKATKAINRQEV